MASEGKPVFDTPGPAEPDRLDRVRAFAVHVFTASGAALGLLALIAAVGHQWSLMFLWLGLALFVDGIDGTFARRWSVSEVLPRWSGDTLDLVVDFVTYVFVPAYAIAAGGLMPLVLGAACGFVIIVTSALYFADRRMKTADNYFRGFPAVWNVIAFYLFLLAPPPWITATVIAAFAAATFVPIPFVHPFRVSRLRVLSMLLLALWAVLAGLALWRGLAPGPAITGTLCAIAVYFIAAGLLRKSD